MIFDIFKTKREKSLGEENDGVITVPIPKILKKYEEYEDGANIPTYVTVYKCPCKKGRIKHYRIPGFDDDYYTIECPVCDKKYDYVTRCGTDFELYTR